MFQVSSSFESPGQQLPESLQTVASTRHAGWARNLGLSFHDILSAVGAEYDTLKDYASDLGRENLLLRQTLLQAKTSGVTDFTIPTKPASPRSRADSAEAHQSQLPQPRKVLSNLMGRSQELARSSSEPLFTDGDALREQFAAAGSCASVGSPVSDLPSPGYRGCVLPMEKSAIEYAAATPFSSAPGFSFPAPAFGDLSGPSEFSDEPSEMIVKVDTLTVEPILQEQTSEDPCHSRLCPLRIGNCPSKKLNVMAKMPQPATRRRKITPVLLSTTLSELHIGGSSSSSAPAATEVIPSARETVESCASVRSVPSSTGPIESESHGKVTVQSENQIGIGRDSVESWNSNGRLFSNAPTLFLKVDPTRREFCERDSHLDVRGFRPRALAAPLFAVGHEEHFASNSDDEHWSDWDGVADLVDDTDDLSGSGTATGRQDARGITSGRTEPIATPRPPDKPAYATPRSPCVMSTPRAELGISMEELNDAVSVS